jgi:fimbrial chaperone protein
MKHFFKAAAAATMAAGLMAAPAFADTFQVDPISVTIAKSDRSADVSIVNRSSSEMRFTLTGGVWSQTSDQPLQITASDNLLVFPEMFRLAPGATQRVRVSLLGSPAQSEQAYRLYIQEMPPVAVPHAGTPKINVVTRIGIPVFQAATQPASIKAQIAGASVEKNHVTALFSNSGTVHAPPSTVNVAVIDGGRTVWSGAESEWYVLANSQSGFSANLPDNVCKAGRSVRLTWHIANASIGADAACR